MESRRHRSRPLALGVGVTVSMIVLAVVASTAPSHPAPPKPVALPCQVSITVSASLEKAAAVTAVADRYTRSGCNTVKVVTESSGDVLNGLVNGWKSDEHPASPNQPEVWSPASTVWLKLLQLRAHRPGARVLNRADDGAASITSTPMVLAIPEPIARKLGWPDRPIGWKRIIEFAVDPQKWTEASGGQWGGFKLGRTNPNYSTLGLHSLIATYTALSGHQPILAKDVADKEIQEKVHAIEMATIHYGETVTNYLCRLAAIDADDPARALAYVSAIAMEEKSVYDFNQGKQTKCPGPPSHLALVAVYPDDGTLMSDSPYAILGNARPDQVAVANDFLDYLRKPEQQTIFKSYGFRDIGDGRLDNDVARSTGLQATPRLNRIIPPSAEALDAILASWQELRKPAHVLFAIDVSLSMDWSLDTTDPPALGQPSRLDLLKSALSQALDGFGRQDEIGVWWFSGNMNGNDEIHPPTVQLWPVQSHLQDLKNEVNRIDHAKRVRSDTPLYLTIRDAHDQLAPTTQPGQITAVVVLTDGLDDYNNRYPREQLIKMLSAADGDHPVRVFTVAYGRSDQQAERKEALSAVATAGGGAYYEATERQQIPRVLREVVSNF